MNIILLDRKETGHGVLTLRRKQVWKPPAKLLLIYVKEISGMHKNGSRDKRRAKGGCICSAQRLI